MADFNIKSKRDEEVESLAMSLRRNKLASSDSEARRMAEEMLSTSKKVQEGFAAKEKQLYGSQKKAPEVELAHKQMEQLASNIARGKSNVRIDINEIDVSKPLKDLVRDEYDDFEKEDDEVAEELKEEPREEVKSEESEFTKDPDEEEVQPEEEPSEEPDAGEGGDAGPGDEPAEPLQADEFDDEDKGDEDKDDSEEESAKDESSEETGEETTEEPAEEASEESSEDEGGEPDFSVKEIDNREQLRKSEEERRKEREKMPESKVDLSNMFNVNK